MLLRIDPAATSPLFEQVADALRAQIHSGALTVGSRLPAARELADSLGMNVHTVLHAYQALRAEGLIELRRGRGAVVTGAPSDASSLREQVAALVRLAREAGVDVEALQGLIREEYRG